MKKFTLLIVFFFMSTYQAIMACEVCEKNQPEPLKGITHGVGPTGTIDYIIITVASIIVAATLYLSIKYLVKPKEGQKDHIKNIVLNEN